MFKYNRLKDLREDNDLKQENIARILKITQQQYGLYERGVREIPFHMIIELAKYYNVTIDYLAGITQLPKRLENKETTAIKNERKLIEAYKRTPQMQNAVNKLLDIGG